MVNRTDTKALSIHGTNPQFLIDQIVRNKIYNSLYWKEECFSLTAETIIDKALKLEYIGGTYGGNRMPTHFLCLILKLLQIQPDLEIIIEFITNEDYKYIRALGAVYYRLVGNGKDVYKVLEPLYNDYSKIRIRDQTGKFGVIHMDELADKLLTSEGEFDIIFPRLLKRNIYEQNDLLPPRKSVLEEDLDELLPDEDDQEEPQEEQKEQPPPQVNNQNNSQVDSQPKEQNPLEKVKPPPLPKRKKGGWNRSSRERYNDPYPKRTNSQENERSQSSQRKEKRHSREWHERDHHHSSHSSHKSSSGRQNKSRTRSREKSRHNDRQRESKGRNRNHDRDSDRRRNRNESPQNNKNEPNEESADYWNSLREKLGLKPLYQ